MILGIIEALAFAIAALFYLRLPLGAGLLLYPCVVILTLFFADFFGVLQPASYFVHLLVAVLFLVSALRSWQSGRWRTWAPFSLKHSVVGVLCLFALVQAALLCSTREFYFWDEFSHWGTVIRVIFEANTFHLEPNPLYFQDYPPGLALFAYHTLQLSGYSEGTAYFSYALLIACLSASLVQLGARGSLIRALCAIIVVWCSVDVLGPGWASLLIDHMLAVFFAGIVATYFLIRDEGSRIVIVPLFLATFSLTKQAALSFALLAAAIIAADWILSEILKPNRSKNWYSPNIWIPGVGLFVALAGAALLTSQVWANYVVEAGILSGWGTYSPGRHVGQFVECCSSARELAVATRFFGAFFNGTPAPELAGSLLMIAFTSFWNGGWATVLEGLFSSSWLTSAPGMAMIVLSFGSLMLVVLSPNRADRLRNACLGGFMLTGGVGYTLSLLLTYLYAFSEYEAVNLASFDRFFSVYLLAWLLTLVAGALTTFNHLSLQQARLGNLFLSILVFVMFSSNIRAAVPIVTPAMYRAQLQDARQHHRLPARESIKSWLADFSREIPDTSRVYIIWPKTSGLEFWLAKHELLPRMTNLTCFGITTNRTPKFVQECTLSEERVRKTLESYDFVVVGDHLDKIHREYPTLFDGVNGLDRRGVFRVVTVPLFRLVQIDED